MKIALYSDLHLELLSQGWRPPDLDPDVVVLAGDIANHTNGIEWAADTFLGSPAPPAVLYVAGNHEYYGAEIYGLTSEMRRKAAEVGISFLENDVAVIDDVRFLGTTLWSDFKLYGSEQWTAKSIAAAKDSLSDYSLIRKSGRTLEAVDTIAIHKKSAAWLDEMLAKPFDGKTVVITHFAPHRGCVAAQFDGDILTPYFTVNMAPLMQKHRIDFWIFGHTHHNVDYMAENGCRVVCNQRGYPQDLARGRENGFRPELVIEL